LAESPICWHFLYVAHLSKTAEFARLFLIARPLPLQVLELPFCGKANSLPDGLCDMDTVLAYFDTITPDDVAEVLRVYLHRRGSKGRSYPSPDLDSLPPMRQHQGFHGYNSPLLTLRSAHIMTTMSRTA
jgi:hypothetical protein